jgi:hypothetical protein
VGITSSKPYPDEIHTSTFVLGRNIAAAHICSNGQDGSHDEGTCSEEEKEHENIVLRHCFEKRFWVMLDELPRLREESSTNGCAKCRWPFLM